jgi:hypothetical protein
MTIGKASCGLLAGLAVVVGLPFWGHWSRGASESVCALNGLPLNSASRVEVIDDTGCVHTFCCPQCAQIWLIRQPGGRCTVRVTDEPSGDVIDSSLAWYVRSSVLTSPTTRNRIHVFSAWRDAERHARTYGGTVLARSEQPFH